MNIPGLILCTVITVVVVYFALRGVDLRGNSGVGGSVEYFGDINDEELALDMRRSLWAIWLNNGNTIMINREVYEQIFSGCVGNNAAWSAYQKHLDDIQRQVDEKYPPRGAE